LVHVEPKNPVGSHVSVAGDFVGQYGRDIGDFGLPVAMERKVALSDGLLSEDAVLRVVATMIASGTRWNSPTRSAREADSIFRFEWILRNTRARRETAIRGAIRTHGPPDWKDR
jgi:hypothetical protein